VIPEGREVAFCDGVALRFGQALPTGGWDRPCNRAAIFALPDNGQGREWRLVVGLNPCRLYDQSYQGFLELIVGQIAVAIANADAYEQERRRSDALAELDRAKTVFFSNVSHEFRTPLTLMLGPLHDLLFSGEPLAPAVRGAAEAAHRNGLRLLRMVNSLLDFSRMEAGRVRASYAPVDLGALSADIASNFRSAIEGGGLRLRIDLEPLPQPAYVDREMWEKILLNLLSNAFKFTLDGEIALTLGPSHDGRSAIVRVSDTGVGIPADELPRLFERFHRIEGQKGRSIEGSGIGLALVSDLVKLHGGDVAVESEPGRGATFSITLPLGHAHLPEGHVRIEAPHIAASSLAHEYLAEVSRWTSGETAAAADLQLAASFDSSVPQSERGRIVVADDNADMRDYVSRLLGVSCDVRAVADGAAALEAVRNETPDLIITDVMMPRLDGFGLLRAIRDEEETRELPVILLSARAGEEARIEGLGAGADDYLVKPFSANELVARVDANLKLARIRRAARTALERRTEQFETLLNQAPLGVYLVDSSLRFRAINPIAARLFAGDVVGREFAEVMRALWPHATSDEVVGHFRRTLETGVPYHVSEEALERPGMEPNEYYEWLISRIPLPEGDYGVVCYFQDISREVNARNAIARSEERLRELNGQLEERVAREMVERSKVEDALRQAQKMEAIGQLTGGVAHDFNNLLTLIIGGLDIIQRGRQGDEARMDRGVAMAVQGARRAAGLTGRLLAFARRQSLEPKPLDLNVLVRDMTELLHRTLGEQIELEGVLAPRLWTIEADQNQLESAILNLAVNARDAMPDGGKLTIETSNAALDKTYVDPVSEVVPGQYAVVAISDTGVGMAPDVKSRVFEPFFTTKEPGQGTGLGLSMVYGFVKQSRGHVTVYSEAGQGTTVKLYFPRFYGDGESKPVKSEKAAPAGASDEAILVLEDNDDVRAYSVMILTELGYRVLQAAEGDHALEILRGDERVDLLFSDVVLPGKSGKVIAEQALALRPGLKVLFTTGYSRNAIVHHGRLDPGVHLIAKPFTFDQLATRVRDLLDKP
jgi:signal transduction histidine kinase